MKMSIAIMGHPKRMGAVDLLLGTIRTMGFEPDLIYAAIDNNNDEWTTGKRALKAGVGKSDWHIVIQDDAILTPDFCHNVEGAIKALPSKTLFSLYTGTSRPLGNRVKAAVERSKDGEWLRAHQLFWGVGIVIPTEHIEPVIEFVEDIELQYDNKVGEFYCRNGLPVYYCIPSLVEHDDDMDSLLGHGQSPEPRVAHRLATGLVAWTSKSRYI